MDSPKPLDQLPLAGRRILITRAHDQAASLTLELEDAGAIVQSIPTIEIRPPQSFQPLDKALKKLPAYDWLVLTSVNGVKALQKRMERAEISPTMLNHLSIAAIGPATCAEAERLGLKVNVIPEQYVAESVVTALRGKVKGKRVLLIRAKVARDVIPRELKNEGAEVDVVEAYETVLPVHASGKLKGAFLSEAPKPDVITFTSSSTASNFFTLLGKGVSPQEILKGVAVASIGPVTSATLAEFGIKATIEAADYTISGLVKSIVSHYAALQNPSVTSPAKD